jgi:hypothetical protein
MTDDSDLRVTIKMYFDGNMKRNADGRSRTVRKRVMLNYGYLTYQAERTLTQAEQRETDAQLGRLSAAFAQLLRLLTKPARALRRQPGTDQPGLRPCMPADNLSYLPGLET